MNPFECEEDNTSTLGPTIMNIIVWKESRGRKTNTYVTGWNIDKAELQGYFKEFKQKHGCNGSLKKEEESDGYKLHFQGDKIDQIIDLIKSKGVDENFISIKGQ